MVSRVGSVGGIRGRRRFIQSEAEKFAPARGRIAGHATGFGGSSTRRRCGMSPTMNRAPEFTRCATRESMCEPDAGAGVSVGINRSVTHRATTRCPQTFLRKPARETGAARAMGAAMVQDMVDILPRSKAVAMGKKTHSRVLLWRVSGARDRHRAQRFRGPAASAFRYRVTRLVNDGLHIPYKSCRPFA